MAAAVIHEGPWSRITRDMRARRDATRRERLLRDENGKFPQFVDTGAARGEGKEDGERRASDLPPHGGRMGLWDVNCKCSGELDNRIISQTVPFPLLPPRRLPVISNIPLFSRHRPIDSGMSYTDGRELVATSDKWLVAHSTMRHVSSVKSENFLVFVLNSRVVRTLRARIHTYTHTLPRPRARKEIPRGHTSRVNNDASRLALTQTKVTRARGQKPNSRNWALIRVGRVAYCTPPSD